MKTVIHPITTMTRNILIGTLFSLSFVHFGHSQSLIENKLLQYKTIQASSIKDINAKYAVALSGLLDEAQKGGDKAAEAAIRVELVGAGHPDKEDWIVGTWSVEFGKTELQIFKFTSDGVAIWRPRSTGGYVHGTYSKIGQTPGYKSTAGGINQFIQNGSGKVEMLHWENSMQYPDKTKATKHKATKQP